jgi:sugar lactone lactonase YvrE
MSRFTAAVRFASILPGVILVAAICFMSSPALYAVQPAAPQLLPYTVSVVAGGGTYGVTANKYTVGNYCGTNTSSPPAGTPPLPLTSWPTALSTVGDGCLATQVLLSVPRGAAADSQGNIFIVDSANQSIRRVDAHTGIITTIAGSIAGTATTTTVGGACPSGSLTATDVIGGGCLATQIIQAAPEGIAVDAAGNVWFTDYTLGAVREVVMSGSNAGVLKTIVNTSGVSGYKADNAAYTATGITASSGKLYRPYGLAFDKYGNLYIADNYNNVVDVVNLGSAATMIAGVNVPAGEIYTIAGSGCPYATSPGCTLATYYGKSNGTGAATSSLLRAPYQVAVDNSGNIYIADEYYYDVRVINTSGTISTFVGVLGTYGSTLPSHVAATTAVEYVYGVATDANGNVYFSDAYSTTVNYVARVDIATGKMYTIMGQTGTTYCGAKTDSVGDGCPGLQTTVYKPYQPSVDAAGNVYITDQGNNLVRKISVGTQFPATVVGVPVTQNIEVHFGVGDTASSYTVPSVYTEFVVGTPSCTTNSDSTTDCVLPITFTPAQAGVRTAPLAVTGTPSGQVSSFSLTGTGLAPVLAVDPGTQSTLASSSLTGVNSIALDAAGNVYASVPGASTITMYTPAGSPSAVGTSLTGANAVAVDASGNVYAALSSGSVVEVPANGGSQVTVGSGFTTPSGVAVDSYGNIYVSDSAANSVTKITAGTGAQLVLVNQTSVPSLSVPTGLAVDTYGNVFVANTSGNNVIEIPFNGSAPITLGSGLSAPTGLAVDPAGSLYIADGGTNKRIVFLPNESGTLNSADQIPIITGLGTPSGVAIAGNGTVYVSDSYASAIYKYVRSSASIDLGNAQTAIGLVVAQTNTAAADIISMGTQPAVFGTSFWTESGTNQSDFRLTPTTIPSASYFPYAGYGVSMTASFIPGATGSRSATYTYGSTTPSTQPTLSLSGTGIQPNDTTTTVINTTVPAGQADWIYGQTVVVNMGVRVEDGLPAPTGNVSVYIDSSSTPVAAALIPGTVSTTAPTTSTASLSIPSLGAGTHNIYAYYGGDSNSASSTSSTLNFTMDQAPLTVTVNSLNKQFDAPLPVLTGTLTGTVNGDQIGVTYSTTATQSSPVVAGGYPITALVTGAAVVNYSVTNNPGTLTILKDNTVTSLGVSATSVNSTTQVILTATVSNQISYSVVSAPTGNVAFFNTVGTTTTQIGTPQPVNSGGIATLTTTFAVVGASTNNSVTAVYLGDGNFLTSTSASTVVVSGVPTIVLVSGAGTNSQLTVSPGQSGLMSFTLTPMYGYNGTITFACSGQSPSVTCSFSPASVVSTGSATPVLVTVTFNTTAPITQLSRNQPPSGIIGSGKLPFSLAALPGLALLFGFSRLRRRFLRGYRSLLLFALCLIGLGFSGCGGGKITSGTPVGTENITITATGTGGSFAGVTQQFTVSLIVQ